MPVATHLVDQRLPGQPAALLSELGAGGHGGRQEVSKPLLGRQRGPISGRSGTVLAGPLIDTTS